MTQPLEILSSEDLWLPGALPPVAGAPPVITGNWSGVSNVALKTKKKKGEIG